MYIINKILGVASLTKRAHDDTSSFESYGNNTLNVPTIFNNNLTDWLGQGDVSTHNDSLVQGIPNFFSNTQFGMTGQLTVSTQFIVVAAMLAVLMRIFARSRLSMKYGWDDLLAFLSGTFLLVNQAIFAKIDFLGM